MYPQITNTEITSLIKPRNADSHKGTYGHSLLVAGSKGKMGAAVIAAKACLRSGTGLLTVNIPFSERVILQTALPEAMLTDRKNAIIWNNFSAIGIGPAIGISSKNVLLLTDIFKNYKHPIVIDADAISILAKHKNLWKNIPAGSILTPHPAEFDRMFGKSQKERMEKAIAISTQYPWVVVLKNHQTLIASEGKAYLNITGNAGLAKGGSGDMLTGMITALLAQGYPSLIAAKIGTYLHGLAADIAIEEAQSMESLLATDVVEYIGKAFIRLNINSFLK
jgi:NAD(P)H-hydrate epimerase